jgi:hypothetical protein
MVETREGKIESEYELGLDLDKLDFIKVEDLSKSNVESVKVYDLEIDSLKNYIVENSGIVHNGGGKTSF